MGTFCTSEDAATFKMQNTPLKDCILYAIGQIRIFDK